MAALSLLYYGVWWVVSSVLASGVVLSIYVYVSMVLPIPTSYIRVRMYDTLGLGLSARFSRPAQEKRPAEVIYIRVLRPAGRTNPALGALPSAIGRGP